MYLPIGLSFVSVDSFGVPGIMTEKSPPGGENLESFCAGAWAATAAAEAARGMKSAASKNRLM